MKKKKSFLKAVSWLVILSLGIFFTARAIKGNVLSGEDVFMISIANPIPEEVNILEGKGWGWRTSRGYVSFTTDEDTMEYLFGHYDLIHDCFIVKRPYGGNFRSVLKSMDSPICFQHKTERHDFYLIWDEHTKEAYFYGVRH